MEDIDDYINRINYILSKPTTSTNRNNVQNKENININKNTKKNDRLLFTGGYGTFEQIESVVKRVLILHREGVYLPPAKNHICNKKKRKMESKILEPSERPAKALKTTFGSGQIGVSCEMYGFKSCSCCPKEENRLFNNYIYDRKIYNEIDDKSQLYIDLTKPKISNTQPTYLLDDSVISISDTSPYNSSDEVIALDESTLETNSSLVIKIENLNHDNSELKTEQINPEDSVTDYIDQVTKDYDEEVMRKYEEKMSAEILTIKPKSPEINTNNDLNVNAPNYANVESITDYVDLITTDYEKELIETIHNDILDTPTSEITAGKKDINKYERLIEEIDKDILKISTSELTFEKVQKPSKNNDNYKANLLPNIPNSKNSSPQLSCSICLDSLKGKEIMSTICGHLFCSECIKECIKKTKACPNCRKKLTLKSIHPIYLN